MIKNLSDKARITEVDSVSDRLLRLYSQANNLQGDQFLKTTFDEMRQLSDAITEAIKRDKVVSNLDQADILRDEAVRNLGDVLTGLSCVRDKNVSENCKRLKAIFDKFGVRITSENYDSESSLIESMLQDFSTDAARQAIGAVQYVNDAIQELRQAEDNFNACMDQYQAAKLTLKSNLSANQIKKQLLVCINKKLVTYLKAMQSGKVQQYVEFAEAVSDSIERTNAAILARKSDEKESPSASEVTEK